MKTDVFIQQLDNLISDGAEMLRNPYQDDIPGEVRQSLLSRAIAAIHRISGSSSIYSVEVGRVLKLYHSGSHIIQIVGIMNALREDLSAGYVQSLAEIAHADVFADFIEMAAHLLEKGYKDAAAVIIGSTLESHLRKLASKSGIAVENNGKAVKAEGLNQELAKATVYGVLEQKGVTAWLDLRNKAAHGEYDKYSAEQVKLLLAGVQDFMVRNPA